MMVAGLCDTRRMRRVWLAVMLASGIVLVPATASWAAPTPTPTTTAPGLAIPVPAAVKPTTVCSISESSNHGAIDITGLVATRSGYVAVDGTGSGRGTSIYTFDSKCSRTNIKSYSGRGANDPEDLAIDKSGTLWVADIGDVGSSRSNIGLWKVPASGSMTLYHFAYPDGPHNASAMVLDGDGRPIFITRNGSGPATLYEAAPGALKTGSSNNALTKVGTFTPEQTGTVTKFSILGQTWVTGAAVSPDGSKVVLRTGSDAYEWTVKSGDMVGAITKGTPTITPMPRPADDPDFDGESIAYTADGTGFLAISKTISTTPLLRFTPAKPIVAASGTKGALKGPKKPSALRAWFNGLSLTDLKLILGGVAVFGLILVLLGIFGIRSSRQKFRLAEAAEARNKPRNDLAPAAVGAPGVYGGGAAGPGAPAPGGGVYGGAPVGGPPGAGVYGARRPRGGPGVYGAPGGNNPGGGSPGGGVYGAPGGGGGAPSGGGASVYGAPREPAYDPYGDGPGADYPPADPYAAPAGPPRSGGQYGGGQYGGGQYGGGQYGSGDQYDGGGYEGGGYDGGQYGNPNGGQYRVVRRVGSTAARHRNPETRTRAVEIRTRHLWPAAAPDPDEYDY